MSIAAAITSLQTQNKQKKKQQIIRYCIHHLPFLIKELKLVGNSQVTSRLCLPLYTILLNYITLFIASTPERSLALIVWFHKISLCTNLPERQLNSKPLCSLFTVKGLFLQVAAEGDYSSIQDKFAAQTASCQRTRSYVCKNCHGMKCLLCSSLICPSYYQLTR